MGINRRSSITLMLENTKGMNELNLEIRDQSKNRKNEIEQLKTGNESSLTKKKSQKNTDAIDSDNSQSSNKINILPMADKTEDTKNQSNQKSKLAKFRNTAQHVINLMVVNQSKTHMRRIQRCHTLPDLSKSTLIKKCKEQMSFQEDYTL